MIVDVEVYIPKRRLPEFLTRFFFTTALIRSNAPHFPRIGEHAAEKRTPVAIACPECSTVLQVNK